MDMLKNLLMTDEIYKKDLKDLKEIRKRYYDLDIESRQRIIIEDYIACLMTVMDRKCELAFLHGIITAKRNY